MPTIKTNTYHRSVDYLVEMAAAWGGGDQWTEVKLRKYQFLGHLFLNFFCLVSPGFY